MSFVDLVLCTYFYILWYIFFYKSGYYIVRVKPERDTNSVKTEHFQNIALRIYRVLLYFIIDCTQIWMVKDHVLLICIQLCVCNIENNAVFSVLVNHYASLGVAICNVYIIAHTNTYIIDTRSHRHPFNVRHLSLIISENTNVFF